MMATMASPWDSVDGAKYEAALTRKGRGGLGFSKDNAMTAPAGASTEASRALMSSAGAFSAQSYLEKFGWKTGSGLGAKGTGIESYVKPTKKFDNAGIGAALTGALVTNAAFETLFNATARSVNIVVFSSSDESSDSDSEARARKKRKRDADKPVVQSQPTTAPSSSPSPQPERPTTLHPSMRLQFRPSSERLLSDESIVAVVEDKQVSLLHTFDPSRSHMYHDRSIGKLARLRAQDAKLAAQSSSPSSPPVASEDSDDSSNVEPVIESNDNDETEKQSKSERKRLRKERKEAKRAAKEAAASDESETQSKKKKKKKRREEKSASSSEN